MEMFSDFTSRKVSLQKRTDFENFVQILRNNVLFLFSENTRGPVPSTNAFSGPPREPKPILESDDEEEKQTEDKTAPQTEQQGESTSQEQGPLHPGVQCDGCNGPVRGTRYKCLVCRDYDLCSTCEAKGIHVEHNMVSITEPFSYSPWGFQGGRGCWRRGGHPCRGRWGHHGAHHGGWFGQHPYPPFFGGPSWGHPGVPPCPSWGAPWAFGHPYFPRGGCHGYRRGGRHSCHHGGKPEATAEGKEEQTAPNPESMETDQRSEDERKTYLRGIGEAVSSFLEPFGIKVDVGVAGEGNQQPTGGDSTTGSEQPEVRRVV